MAKYQACEFIRTSTSSKLRKDARKNKHWPKHTGWEKGIARVPSFGSGDVEYIIDETGRKLPWRLANGLAYAAIDTEIF